MSFASWLRKSNEAKAFRDAFDLVDQMSLEFGIRLAALEAVRHAAERAWEETKAALQIEQC